MLSWKFLRKYKNQLKDPLFLITYGFLYEEYEDEFYFWESIIMLRKFLVVTVIIFLSTVGLEIQILVALGVVIFAMVLQVIYNPYELWQMDVLERTSLYATCGTLYISMFYMLNDIPKLARYLFSVVLMFGNVLVVLYFVWNVVREMVFGTADKIDDATREKIASKMGCCGRRIVRILNAIRSAKEKVLFSVCRKS